MSQVEVTYGELVMLEIHLLVERIAEHVAADDNLSFDEAAGVPFLLFGLEEALRKAAMEYMNETGKLSRN